MNPILHLPTSNRALVSLITTYFYFNCLIDEKAAVYKANGSAGLTKTIKI